MFNINDKVKQSVANNSINVIRILLPGIPENPDLFNFPCGCYYCSIYFFYNQQSDGLIINH